jgi:hypothetical protein
MLDRPVAAAPLRGTPVPGLGRPEPDRHAIPWKGILVLTIASILLRVGIFAWFRLGAPLGEDAEFWGYRALELLDGQLVGTHPPAYPAMALLFKHIVGWDLAYSAQAISYGSGTLMAPAMALGLTPIVGRRAGLLSGAFVLVMPALMMSSLRVEPTSLFIFLLGVLLFVVGRAIERRSAVLGAIAGLMVPFIGLVKENGFLYTLVLLPLLFVALRDRRVLLTLATLGAFCLGLGGIFAMDAKGDKGNLSHKVSLPVSDTIKLVESGYLPPPILAKEDVFIQPSAAVRAEIAAEDTAPMRRVYLFAVVQALRIWRFLGLWLVVAPVAGVVAWRAWRDGTLRGWQLSMLGALTVCLIPGIFVIIQPRHAEPGALGIVAAAALGLTRLSLPSRRWATLAAVLLATGQGVFTFYAREFETLGFLARSARERQKTAWDVERWVPDDARLCSTSFWIGFYTGRLVLTCAEGREITPGTSAWVVGSRGDVATFETRVSELGGSVDWQTTFTGESFDKMSLGEVSWGTGASGGGANGKKPPGGGQQGNKPPLDGQQGNKPPLDGQQGNKPPLDGQQGNKPPLDGQQQGNKPPLDGQQQGNKPPLDGQQQGNKPPLDGQQQGNKPPLNGQQQGNRPPLETNGQPGSKPPLDGQR